MRRTLRSIGALFAALLAVALGAGSAWAAKVVEVRVGTHPSFTRVVFELDSPAGYRVERKREAADGELLIVTLEASSPPRSIRSRAAHIESVRVEEELGRAVARVRLRQPKLLLKEMILANPPRIVLDLSSEQAVAPPLPRPSEPSARRPEPKAGAKRESEPKVEAKREPEPTPAVERKPEATAAVTLPRGALEATRSAPGTPEVTPRTAPQRPAAEPRTTEAKAVAPPAPSRTETTAKPTQTRVDSPTRTPPPTAAPPAPRPVAKPAPAASKPTTARPEATRARPPRPPDAGWQGWLERLPVDPMVAAAVAGGVFVVVLATLLVMRRRSIPNDDEMPAFGDGLEMDELEMGGGREDYEVADDSQAFEDTGASAPLAGPGAAGLYEDEEEKGESEMEQINAPAGSMERSLPRPAAAGGDADLRRVVSELERRLSQVETRLDESVDACERLERQVAAQSEELRVQRAAIARTQRALRSLSRAEEEQATEPALREPR